jgi:hypothetical protein
LTQQLNNGIRVIDIRVRYLPGANGKVNFSIHHADDYQYAFFDSKFPYTSDCKYFVLDECLDFLDQNPTECIVMLVKQEKDMQARNTFFDAFWKIVDNRAGSNNLRFYTGNNVPRLKDARGRIVFVFVDGEVSDPKLDNPRWGLYWGNIDYRVDHDHVLPGQQPNLDVENHWKDMMNAKWDKVEKHLGKALTGTGPASIIWFTTFVSASNVWLAGHLPEDYADFLLPKVQKYLTDNSTPVSNRPWGSYFGTAMMDFPTTAVINLLVTAAQKYQYPIAAHA